MVLAAGDSVTPVVALLGMVLGSVVLVSLILGDGGGLGFWTQWN